MKHIFTSITTIEFEDEKILEAFVQTLPLSPAKKKNILDGKQVTDSLDESGFPGAGNMVHKFNITEKE